MSKQTLVGIGVVVVAAVIAGVLLTTNDQASTSTDVEGVATSTNELVPNLINAGHQYNEIENLHIVAGTADVPTACHDLDYEVALTGENPTQATIAFTTEVVDEDQVCAQVITARRFKVTFEAGADVEIDGTYNGEPVELNLQMVGPNENLEEFEVYTKG